MVGSKSVCPPLPPPPTHTFIQSKYLHECVFWKKNQRSGKFHFIFGVCGVLAWRLCLRGVRRVFVSNSILIIHLLGLHTSTGVLNEKIMLRFGKLECVYTWCTLARQCLYGVTNMCKFIILSCTLICRLHLLIFVTHISKYVYLCKNNSVTNQEIYSTVTKVTTKLQSYQSLC